MGDRAIEVFHKCSNAGDYSEGYYIYGLSVALAEALAEWTHRLVRTELELGSRAGPPLLLGLPGLPGPGGAGQAVRCCRRIRPSA